MKRSCLISLPLVAALLGVGLWFVDRGPMVTKPSVKSPDGKHEAYIQYHGWLDSQTAHLYIRDADGKVVRGPNLSGSDISYDQPVWSDDSTHVAVLVWFQMPFAPECLHVWNPASNHTGEFYEFEECLRRAGDSLSIHTKKSVELKWLGSNALVMTAVSEGTSGEEVRNQIAAFAVSDTGTELRVSERSAAGP